MKRLISIILLLIPISGYATTPKIVPSKDMTYLGAFRLSSPPSGYSYTGSDAAGRGRKTIEYLPTDGSLIVMVTKNLYRYPMKVSIPIQYLSKSKTFTDLTQATVIHAPVNIAVDPWGRLPQQGYSFLGDIHYLPAKGSQSTGKLYWSLYGSYVTPCMPFKFCNGHFGWAELDFDNFNQAGMWALESGCYPTSNCCSASAKYLFHAPQDWADTYTGGKSLLAGFSSSGGTSGGPQIYAFAPWEACGGNPINCDTYPPPDARNGVAPIGTGDARPALDNTLPHKQLLGYPNVKLDGNPNHNVLQDKSVNDAFNSARWLSLGDKRAIVFNGNKCFRSWDSYTWSYPSNYYPQAVLTNAGDNTGYHADPCTEVLWFYDQDDITAVAQGTKQAYQPQPYCRIELRPYFLSETGQSIFGMAYDEANQYLFIEEVIDSSREVIHVFRLADSKKTTLDTTPPSPPVLTLISANKSEVRFSWPAVSDDSGLFVLYRIYRNGYPIAIQAATTYTDSYLSYYTAPVDYRVDAVDFEGNVASSNTLSIDSASSGNVPMTIFIPLLGSSSGQHETSNLRFKSDGTTTFTPEVKGGTPPYTWFIQSFPSGININSSTGELSGVPATSTYGGKLIVKDAYDNYARRKVQVGKKDTDLDCDGIKSLADGGPDTDDLNCNVRAGLTPSQPAPTNLTISRTTGTSVSITWAAATNRTDPTGVEALGIIRKMQLGLDIYYQVYHGTQSRVYTDVRYVGMATSYTWEGLKEGTHYFSVTAIDFTGLESIKSNEVSQGTKIVTPLNGQAYGAYYAEGLDQSASIVDTADGGVIIVGPTWSYAWNRWPGTEVARVMMLKTNSSGVEQWRRIIGPEGYNITKKQNSVLHWQPRKVILSNTSPVIVGYRGTSGTEGINGFLMKFDSSGNIIWDRSFNNTTKNDYLFDVVERKGGGFAACGQGWAGSESGFWLLLTDSNGQNPFSHYYTKNSKGWATGRAIRKTSDGGYILAGYTATGGVQDEDYYVVKVTSDGTQSWAYRYDNSGRRDMATGIEEDANGNFWVFGRSGANRGKNTKIWIVKLNSSGVLQASYEIGDDDTSHVYVARGSIKLSKGNFLVIGYTNVSSSKGYHGYIAEINNSGSIVRSATIGAIAGTTEEYLFGGVVSGDGNYYRIIGTDNGSFSTAYDFWYLKLSATDLSVQNFTPCDSKTTFFYDKDLDGYGNNYQWSPAMGGACFAMPGYVLTHNDPDDSNPSITP